MDRDYVERIKNKFKAGMRICLDYMKDDQAPPSGTEGTVDFVDDMGTVFVRWDNGSHLGLIPDEDDFEILH